MTAIAAALVTGVLAVVGTLTAERLKRKWDRDTQARKLIGEYRDPLLRAAFNLQSRLYNIVVWDFLSLSREGERASKDYAVDTTAWHFAHYLGWVEILRHDLQFLDLGTARRNKQLQARLGAVAHALASDRAGYRPAPAGARSARARPEAPRGAPATARDQRSGSAVAAEPLFMIYRTDQQAIGEAMFKERPQGDESSRLDCLTFSEFKAKLNSYDKASPDPLARWFQRFAHDLEELARGAWNQRHPRLIAIQNGLIDLIDLLDPEQERFPDRDHRGKVPEPNPTHTHPFRIAHFVWPDDPSPIIADWAAQYGCDRVMDDLPINWTLERPPRSRLGATLVVRVTRASETGSAWLSIEGWTRLPPLLRPLRRAVVAGTDTAEVNSDAPVESSKRPADQAKHRVPLEANSIFLPTSQGHARYAANQLLTRFGRPRVLGEPVPRRQLFFVVFAALLLAIAGIATGLALGSGGSDPGTSVPHASTVTSPGTASTGTTGTAEPSHTSSSGAAGSSATATASTGTATRETTPAPASSQGATTTPPVTVTEKGPGVTTLSTETTTAPNAGVTPVARATIALPTCATDELRSQCRAHRSSIRAWRTIHGTVITSASAPRVRGVEVAMTRVTRGRCAAYTGFGFSRTPCAEAFGLWLPVSYEAGRWSMVVRSLTRGSYVIRARAIDASSRQQRPPVKLLLTLR